MLKSYFISLYRNILRNKFYSVLNILGLSIGLATALFILLYVTDESGYDKHFENCNRIYRVESEITVNNNPQQFATAPPPLGPALKKEIPEIEEVVRIDELGLFIFRYEEHEFFESRFFYADSSIFRVFNHDFIYGNPGTCLTEPSSIVLTRLTSEKYFGSSNPTGKILTDSEGDSYQVTAVIENLPSNTHLKYDALISVSTIPDKYSSTLPARFWRLGAYTFLLLHENAKITSIHDRFPAFYEKYMEALGKQYNVHFRMMTTPLAETHFRKGLSAEQPSGNRVYIFIFSSVTLFILLLAAINYMNMATARSATRSREVGMRKVFGADKRSLIYQFLSESVILSLVSLFVAVLLVGILLPFFNDFTGKEVSLNPFENSGIFLLMFIVSLFIGLLSGSYPAFYLSSFQPMVVLKGKLSKSGKQNLLLRRVLVVFQFFIAIFMIISTFVIMSQLSALRNKDLGFEKNDLIVIELHGFKSDDNIETVKQELLQNKDILSITNSTGSPGKIQTIQNMKIDQDIGMADRAVLFAKVDYDFIGTFRFRMIAGRDFDKSMGTDYQEAVLINETAMNDFGWKENPIGKRIHYGYDRNFEGGRHLKVIGVMGDFHFKSLHNSIEPVIFFLRDDPGFFLTCRIRPGTTTNVVEWVDLQWNRFGSGLPLKYASLSSRLDEMYVAEDKIATLILLATFITIFIALLGLLGLSAFVAEQKTKEIGLRKILGASTGNILGLMYRDFMILILIAFAIAIPVAWWRLNIWLEQTFVYFQPIDWINFLFAGLVTVFIGMATISFYIIKAAVKNPVEAIKYE